MIELVVKPFGASQGVFSNQKTISLHIQFKVFFGRVPTGRAVRSRFPQIASSDSYRNRIFFGRARPKLRDRPSRENE